jgi:hypothetical protein
MEREEEPTEQLELNLEHEAGWQTHTITKEITEEKMGCLYTILQICI